MGATHASGLSVGTRLPSTTSWRCLQKGSSATCEDDADDEVEGEESAVAAAEEEKDRFANAAAAPSVLLEHDATPDVRAAAAAARSWEAARRMVLGACFEKKKQGKRERVQERKGD